MSGDIIATALGWILTFIQLLPDLLARLLGGRG